MADGAVSKSDEAEYAYTGFGDMTWTDYTFRLKVKLEQGFVEINFRVSGKESTYAVGLLGNQISLSKSDEQKTSKAYSFAPDQFYDIRIEATGSNIKVYVDDGLQIDYTDTDNPSLAGNVGLYISDKAYIDEIAIEGP